MGVSVTLVALAIYTQIFHRTKNNIMFKKPSKRNQNPSRYYDPIITNLKFQHKPKYHLSKILILKKIDLLTRGQNALRYYTL